VPAVDGGVGAAAGREVVRWSPFCAVRRPVDLAVRPTPPTDAWYRTAFDVLYSRVYRHRDDASAREEVDALLGLLGGGGGRVLDVACGAGRHLRAMLDRGMDGYGMDLSPALLAEAVADRGLARRVVQADMRRVPFAAAFDLVTNLFTSFGYFESEAENAMALRSMARVLRPGGRLVVDHANRHRVQANLVEADRQQVDELIVDNRRRIENGRMIKDMTITCPSGWTERVTERVRLYEPDELARAFAAAGLGDVRIYGSFAGEPLGGDSERMIVIGARA
jgi:SAM-dependent methyltransferase